MSLQGARVARNVGVLSSEAAGTGLNWPWERRSFVMQEAKAMAPELCKTELLP